MPFVKTRGKEHFPGIRTENQAHVSGSRELLRQYNSPPPTSSRLPCPSPSQKSSRSGEVNTALDHAGLSRTAQKALQQPAITSSENVSEPGGLKRP